MKIENARALVTGGAQGMGRCFVEQFRDAGAKVAFCDVNAEGVKATSDELGVPGFVADVSDEESVASMIGEASEALGGLNVLVNNAGITRDGLLVKKDRNTGDLKALSLAKWNQVLAVNLTGPFLCTRAFTIQCIEREINDACIVNMSSISKAGNMGQGNYSASKAGQVGLMRSLCKEVAKRKITVNCVSPGFIATELLDDLPEDLVAGYKKSVPARRFGTPEEVASAVLYLASKEASYITGTTLDVTGGL